MPDPLSLDPKQNPFPAIPEAQPNLPSMLSSVRALTQNVKILTGELGSRDNRALLKKEYAPPGSPATVLVDSPSALTLVGLCVLAKSSNQTLPNVTFTAVTWDVTLIDTLNVHDPVVNNSRITIPAGVTHIEVSYNVGWRNDNVWGIHGIRQNSVFINYDVSSNYFGNVASQGNTPLFPVSPGDIIDLLAYRDGGSGVICGPVPGPHTARLSAKFYTLALPNGLMPSVTTASRTSAQAIPHNVWTTVAWQDASYLNDSNMWSASNPTRFTFPAGVTRFDVNAYAVWAATATPFLRGIRVKTNTGAQLDGIVTPSGLDVNHTKFQSPTLRIGTISFIEFDVYQSTGASLGLVGGSFPDFVASYAAVRCW